MNALVCEQQILYEYDIIKTPPKLYTKKAEGVINAEGEARLYLLLLLSKSYLNSMGMLPKPRVSHAIDVAVTVMAMLLLHATIAWANAWISYMLSQLPSLPPSQAGTLKRVKKMFGLTPCTLDVRMIHYFPDAAYEYSKTWGRGELKPLTKKAIRMAFQEKEVDADGEWIVYSAPNAS